MPEINGEDSLWDEEVRERDGWLKLKSQDNQEEKKISPSVNSQPGDTVLLKQEKSCKLASEYADTEYKVIERSQDTATTTSRDGTTFTRNIADLKKTSDQVDKKNGL